MMLKKNCDDWVKYARENWLDDWIRKLPKNKYLSESAQNMVDRMTDASSKGRTEEAWNLMERLKRMSGTFYGTGNNQDMNYHDQWAEIYMECALVAYDLGDLSEALELLRTSIGNFYQNRTLHKAVNYWLVGCIQWQLPAHSEEAVVSWERATTIVKDVAVDSDNQLMRDKVIGEMRRAINSATRLGFPKSPYDSDERLASTEMPRPSARTFANSSSMRVGFLPYFGSIPAGDPVAALKRPEGEARINSLEVNGRIYELVNIKRNEQEVSLPRSYDYFLMEVKGDSMKDASPIKIISGDYVLLRNTPEAYSNDIVAAVIVGIDSEATLKRYIVEGSDKFLKFENIQDPKKILLKVTDYIQGVVVAILKPQ